MRELFPIAVDPVDPMAVYGALPLVDGRPAVRLNMIASVDGATAVGGVSGSLGGPADRRLFGQLRAVADCVVVGAGTFRAEHYGPARLPVAVVSRSCRLDWEAPFFTQAVTRPVVITVSAAPAADRAAAAAVADVVVAGDDAVDLHLALGELAARGARNVLAEGGPSLNEQLAAAGLLDELCLTVSPRIGGGTSARVFGGDAPPARSELRLLSVCEEDEFLFLRYRPAE